MAQLYHDLYDHLFDLRLFLLCDNYCYKYGIKVNWDRTISNIHLLPNLTLDALPTSNISIMIQPMVAALAVIVTKPSAWP